MSSRRGHGWAQASAALGTVRLGWLQVQPRTGAVILGGSAALTAALGVDILGLLIGRPMTILVIAAPIMIVVWLRRRRGPRPT